MKEVIDRRSGAILFKKDPDALKYEDILQKLNEYQKRIEKLEKRVKELEKTK